MKIRKAIIPAAGLGTRFLPITKAVPKPMLPIVDKPTIQYITEELQRAGIEQAIIVVSPGSDVIRDHFGAAEELEKRLLSDGKKELYEIERETQSFNVKFVEQEQANGLAGAILCAEKYVGDEPFALLLGDEMIYAASGEQSCLERLVEVYEKTGKTVLSTMEVFGDDVSKYGNIGIAEEKDGIFSVNAIVEKPSVADALSNYAIIGRYVIASGIMGKLKKLTPRNNEIYLTDVLDELAASGQLVATEVKGVRYDVGDKAGFIKANLEYGLRNKAIGEDLKAYVKELAKKI